MRWIVLAFTGLSCMACLGDLPPADQGGEPYVQSVNPLPDAVLEGIPEVRIGVSRPIDPQSVHARSFLVTPAAESPVSAAQSDQIQSDIEKGKLTGLEGSYRISGDRREITWSPAIVLAPQAYQVVLTSGIQTPDRFPLNQTPGRGNRFFVSAFTVTGSGTGLSPNPNPSVPPSDAPRPETLFINEILYDPADAETDGSAFVELYGTPGSALHGHVIRFVNGADGKKTGEAVLPAASRVPEDGFFVLADAKTGAASQTRVANADLVSNFDPQNGPDSVQLLAPDGEVLDVVGYGEGMTAADSEGNPLWEGQPAPDAASGFSLSRVDQRDTDDNRHDFVVNESPSPGNGEAGGAELSAELLLSREAAFNAFDDGGDAVARPLAGAASDPIRARLLDAEDAFDGEIGAIDDIDRAIGGGSSAFDEDFFSEMGSLNPTLDD